MITQNPQGATVLAGKTATPTVAAASTTTLTYPWQSQPPGGSFANIPRATSSTYTTPATQALDNGTQFRVVVTNYGGSVNSSAATLNVLSGTTAFITSSTPGAARNDFDGRVGMIMTVGANPLIISSMGRVCAPGNSGTHIVKFVAAATETDSVGAGVSVNMAGQSLRAWKQRYSYGEVGTGLRWDGRTRGSASMIMAGGAAGEFSYAASANPITL